MKNFMTVAIIIGALFLGGMIFYGCSGKSYEDITLTSEYTPEHIQYYGLEKNLLDSINIVRLKNNLNILTPDIKLSLVADSHTEYMIEEQQLSHENFSDRVTVLNNNNFKSVGEVVGYGYNTALGFIEGYEKSPSHNKIVKGSSYTHVGISVMQDSKQRNYNTIVFGKY